MSHKMPKTRVLSRAQHLSRQGVHILVVGLFFLLASNHAFAGERQKLNFNPDWKFTQTDPIGAAESVCDDREWKTVSTPHTFNDADTFNDWSLSGHRGEQNQWSGRTWYRKTFTLPESFRGKKVFIEFEAARQVAEVYLNGKFLGVSKTGFTPFGFDLTPHLKFGAENVIAVMCDNRFMKDPWEADGAGNGRSNRAAGGPEIESVPRNGSKLSALSAHFNATIPETLAELQAHQIPWNNPHWHPAHGGIYRNVYLHVTDPLHVTLPLYSFLQTTGPYVYAQDVTSAAATLHVEVPIENGRKTEEKLEVRAEVFDADGRSVLVLKQAGSIAAGRSRTFQLAGTLLKPRLWAPAYPHLYRVVCAVRVKGETVDTSEVNFGVRSARWDLQTGFSLNGRHLKLRGWGLKPTEEWPGLGAAQPDWVHFFTMQLIKDAGGNFVRWGHCAGGPASVLASDRLGLITDQPGVDGESDTRGGAWTLRVEAFRDVVVYFRNSPSIVIWEGGNQKVSREHAQELKAIVTKFDPHGGRAYAHRRADKTTAEFMEIGIGTEGGREIPTLPVVEGEYNREESPRRVWDDFSPPNFGYLEGRGQTYHLNSEQFAVNQVMQYVRKLSASEHSGGANWIFSDSTSGGRVTCEVARVSGEVDGVRLPKEAYYACRAMFRADPQVHIIGHWTYPEKTRKNVYVVANGDEVELFVNKKSLGRVRATDRYLFTFPDVNWEAGEIQAVSYREGKKIASQTKRTAGAPVALRLMPITGPEGWHADGADVVFVDVEAVDAKGERCPTLQRTVHFSLTGGGEWLGGYESGCTNSIRNYNLDLECGINRVAIRAGRQAGATTLAAKCKGLKTGQITLTAKPFEVSAHQFTQQLPTTPKRTLLRGLDVAAADTMPVIMESVDPAEGKRAGQFTLSFSYSGPTDGVRVERDARDGKIVYADRDYAFKELPVVLQGADYVCAANGDRSYNAVDLMELAVKADTVIYVAHDDRLPRPAWLTRQFVEAGLTLTIQGQPMKLYQRRAETEQSLTLGANAENSEASAGQMYVVFVKGKARMLAERDGRSQ
jgi:beta-galactosidase